MFNLLANIAEAETLPAGLFDFFAQFESKEEALKFWAKNFEKSDCEESRVLIEFCFVWSF